MKDTRWTRKDKSVKVIESEETDSGDEMDGDDNDIVLL